MHPRSLKLGNVQHAIPWQRSNTISDQPWLTPEERAMSKVLDNDAPAFMMHYILTEDMRIIEEPNFMLWGIFLERCPHRFIEQTLVARGLPNMNPHRACSILSGVTPWSIQRRPKRRSEGPSIKPQHVSVSTVFVGTCADELFETMIFGGLMDQIRWKTQTLEDAKVNHFNAVKLARDIAGYMRHHGKHVKKLWHEVDRFWRLARMRGEEWARKHLKRLQYYEREIDKIGGNPNFPQPSLFLDLYAHIVARPSTWEIEPAKAGQ